MKYLLFVPLLLVFALELEAQTPVGLIFDTDGNGFEGYFDELGYAAVNKLRSVHTADSYENGSYYDQDGTKFFGLVKFKDNKIWFKTDEDASPTKLSADEVPALIIGVDSFFSVSDYDQIGFQVGTVFMKSVAEVEGVSFAKFYNFKTRGIGVAEVDIRYYVRDEGSQHWNLLPEKQKRFHDEVPTYFDSTPALADKISEGVYTPDEILTVIKLGLYESKYKKGEPIYFDRYWQETRDNADHDYHAIIRDKQDSIWTFDYFKRDQKIYSVQYSSFFPHRRNGDFIIYHPNGAVMKTMTFVNNEPKEVHLYDNNGKHISHYTFEEVVGSVVKTEVRFQGALTRDGYQDISETGSQVLEVYDMSTSSYYQRTFEDGKLITSCRVIGHDTVYQVPDGDFNFKVKRLKTRFISHMLAETYDGAIEQNAQGMVLVNVLVNRKGNVLEYELLNSLHPEIDEIVTRFISARVFASTPPMKFKKFKVNGEKQLYEFVIPIEFAIDRFYKEPRSNYYYPNHMMHMQMMHQQMHQQMMNNITPPPAPSFSF